MTTLRHIVLLLALPTLAFAQSTPRFTVVKVGPFPPAADTLLQQAVRILNQNYFSDAFRQRVAQAHMLGTKLDRRKLTAAQVYARVTHPNQAGTIVMRVALAPQAEGDKEVGITVMRGGDTLTTTHLTYIQTNGPACYAAHLAHEYCHWRGFTHPFWDVPLVGRQKQFVPYVVGDLFADYLGAKCP